LSKYTENIQKYKSFNNTFYTLKREKKALCYRKILEEAIEKLSNKSSFRKEFLINNIPVSDKKELVESFNIFFTNISTRTSHNVPPSNKCFSLFMNQPLRNSSFIQYVAPDAIIDIFNKIKPKSSFEKMKYRQS